MGARSRSRRLRTRDERGQSLIELLVMLPILVGFILLLVRTNSAIQTSIVNQQYARSHALFMAQNSPIYPSKGFRPDFINKGLNLMTIGVSDKASPIDEDGKVTGKLDPEATVHQINRNKASEGSDDPKTEPDSRSRVRVRTTVGLCTANFVLKTGGSTVPILKVDGDGKPVSTYREVLGENTSFDLCRSNYNE